MEVELLENHSLRYRGDKNPKLIIKDYPNNERKGNNKWIILKKHKIIILNDHEDINNIN